MPLPRTKTQVASAHHGRLADLVAVEARQAALRWHVVEQGIEVLPLGTRSRKEPQGAARSRKEPQGAARSRKEPQGAARSRKEPHKQVLTIGGI